MMVLWYVGSAVMIANGLVMLLLGRDLDGAVFIAIGVGFIVLRQYRLQRDRNRLRRDQGQTFD
jgi:hypothetical protein